jgi:hypothetical protein
MRMSYIYMCEIQQSTSCFGLWASHEVGTLPVPESSSHPSPPNMAPMGPDEKIA